MKKNRQNENEVAAVANAGVISYTDVQQRIVCVRDTPVGLRPQDTSRTCAITVNLTIRH